MDLLVEANGMLFCFASSEGKEGPYLPVIEPRYRIKAQLS